jgi:signal transduction histidine kinase
VDQEADDLEIRPSARAVRGLRVAAVLGVLGVLGPSTVVAGLTGGALWRPAIALLLVAGQAGALWWVVQRPEVVLVLVVAMGVAVWGMVPAVSVTGALLAAQFALCVLSALRPVGISRRWLLGTLAVTPLALAGGGAPGVVTCVLAMTLAWTGGQWHRMRQGRLLAEVRRAVAEERARIFREVHDVVAHTVSVMVIQAGAAEDVFPHNPEQARRALRAIDDAGRSALNELRFLLSSIRPDADDDERQPPRGMARLGELAAPVRAAGVTVDIHQEGRGALAAAVDLAGYRIVQEALTNSLRHAVDVTEIRVAVRYEPRAIHIAVVDDGRTSARDSRSARGGRGLVGMRERVLLLGGTLKAGPTAAGGFEVVAELPVDYSP